MSATRILWGQIVIALVIVLLAIWAATQWTAWRLGFPPQLGQPWFYFRPGMPVYLPAAFFWWLILYDAYAPRIFLQGACIAASGGLLAAAAAFALSIWRARDRAVETYGSARWAKPSEVRRAGLLGSDGVVLGRYRGAYLRHDGPERVLCFAPTRSGKGVGLVVPSLFPVGEVRGAEALELLKAWGTGHPGGIGKIHAGSATGALHRLEQLIQEVVVTVPRALIVEAINVIAVLAGRGTSRRLIELAVVEGVQPGGAYVLAPAVKPNGDL